VHQVLSYERIHGEAASAECRELNSYESSRLSDLVEYGPRYLIPEELHKRKKESLASYYEFLGVSVFHCRDKAFWGYHEQRFRECGQSLSKIRVARAAIAKGVDLMLNPKQTAEKLLRSATAS
jgi:hypothetical protein